MSQRLKRLINLLSIFGSTVGVRKTRPSSVFLRHVLLTLTVELPGPVLHVGAGFLCGPDCGGSTTTTTMTTTTFSLFSGGPRVRAVGDFPPWSSAQGRCQGSGHLLHHPLHRHVQEGRPQDGLFRCSAAGGECVRAGDEVLFDVMTMQVLSRDSVTVTVDAVVYYRVSNPTMATNNVEDFR